MLVTVLLCQPIMFVYCCFKALLITFIVFNTQLLQNSQQLNIRCYYCESVIKISFA